MKGLLEEQYECVKDARRVLLNFCGTVAHHDFNIEPESAGGGGIKKLLIHNADTYKHWLGNFALNKQLSFFQAKSFSSINEVVELYAYIDEIVSEFLSIFEGRYDMVIKGKVFEKKVSTSPLKLFTHVITHEFHHKGQILAISRKLGYTPPDTDIIRFS